MANDVTQILAEVTSGNRARMDELFQLLYQDLKAAAVCAMQGERVNHSLQPTALVHQVYLKLIDQTRVDWKNRSHFCAVASTLMRRILVDHARTKLADKRGGGAALLSLVVDPAVLPDREEVDLIELDSALTTLEKLNPRHARIIELRFFSGLSIEETAQVLEISDWTVKNDWRAARAWMLTQLDGEDLS